MTKKATGIASVTYDEALDVALCYGWIDGQRKPLEIEEKVPTNSIDAANKTSLPCSSKVHCAQPVRPSRTAG